ncbi:MAG: ATP-binding cassette domain-containing protein [Bilophila wadsworthia]
MEPSRRPLIEIEHVFVTYPGTERHILNDFNLTLYEGEHAVIRGGNGAGKSTLLRLLRGEQWPDQIDHRRAGRVLWHGPEGADPSPLTGRKVTSLVSAMRQGGLSIRSGGWTASVWFSAAFPTRSTSRSSHVRNVRDGVSARTSRQRASFEEAVTAMSQGQLRRCWWRVPCPRAGSAAVG